LRISGIIAEYDPFHKGHATHIAATRAENGGDATHIVAVISSSFTQRGEPALLNKFHRTEMALACGVDLVLELPLPWAMSSAESFASGGVAILKALGCVEMLSFGSECGDIATLQHLAFLSESTAYQDTLRRILSTGIPYAAAGQVAAATILGEKVAAHLASPNNTLGIEYMRAATMQKAKFDFFTLKRHGALHNANTPNQGFASASLIRDAVRKGDITLSSVYMPNDAFSILEQAIKNGQAATCSEKLEYALMAQLRKMSEEDFDSVVSTNLKGTFNCVKHAARQMLKQKSGRIINISSVSGVMGNAGQANYCASKAGVIGLTKSVARELGSRGITSNAVAPGFIETEMTSVLPEDVKKAMGEQIPLKRFGQTQDIAETVAFLASDKAGYITGQVIQVDGGMAT